MDRSSAVAFARDSAVVTLLAGGLIAAGIRVDVTAVQLPAYLLIVGFDLLQAAVGAWVGFEAFQFGAYLAGLGLFAAAVGHLGRTRLPESGVAGWRFAVAGFVGLLGGVSLVIAASVLVGSSQREPVAIAGTVGILALVLAAWLSGHLDLRTGPATVDR